eukprot:291363_1
MATNHSRFNSPFIYTTFAASDDTSIYSVYKQRIIDLYQQQYPSIKELSIQDINSIITNNKITQFKKQQQQQISDAKKQEKQPEENKLNNDNNDKKDDKKDNNNIPSNNNEIKNNEESNINTTIKMSNDQKKLIKALELLENEYFGNEHNLYVYLCTKYKIEIICEYNNNNNMNRVIDKLLENKSDIKCIECAEIKPYYSYNKSELENGYFAACKECAPDRDSVKTLKWSAIYKSADTQLKNNNFVLQNSRDSHRYACVDMNNPMKQGIHCFRWYVKGHRSWLLLGISKPRKHRDGSYSDQGVFGIASAGTYYKNGATMYDIPAAAMYEKQEIFIDMKLDLSKYEMSYMVVGDAQKRLMKMTGIDKNNKDGYIPHVNVYYQSVTLQIKKIPSSWFGKNPKRCKFKY